MKYGSSLKSALKRSRDCYIAVRKGKKVVLSKTKKRVKLKQG